MGFMFRAFCTFCTLMSRTISQEYSLFCKIFVLFAGIFIYVIKSVFIQSLTFRVITQFGQQSSQHFARPFSLKPHHILWKGNNPLKHILQTLFAKLMISSDLTFILHVFLAECVCFLTYIDELTYHLAIIGFN